MTNPSISVLVPTYNQARADAYGQAFARKTCPKNLIVTNGNGKDESPELCTAEEFALDSNILRRV